MTRSLVYLTADQLFRLATAAPEERAVDLALELGAPYDTVHKALQRFRLRGWTCPVHWTTCAICGRPLAYGVKKRLMHPACQRERVNQSRREWRKVHPGSSTPYVRQYRLEHPEAEAEMRRRELAKMRAERQYEPDELAALIAKAHAADKRDQAATAELAESSGDLWTAEEDQYVLDHLREPARDVALALGRTLWGVRGRRVRLRRELGLPVKRSKYD